MELKGTIKIMPNLNTTHKFWHTGANAYDAKTGMPTELRSDQLTSLLSFHTLTPRWHPGKRQYLTPGIDDEELQQIVKTLDLYDDQDKIIEKANRNNKNDKFFNHKSFRIKMRDNAALFNADNALEKLRASIVISYGPTDEYGTGLVAPSSSDLDKNPSARWYISNASLDHKKVIDAASEKKEAFTLYNKLSATKKRKYLSYLTAASSNGLSIKEVETASDEFVDATLYTKYVDTDEVGGDGVKRRVKFIALCSIPAKRFAISNLITDALGAGLLRKKGLAIYNKSDVKIATSIEALIDEYSKPDNQQAKDDLEHQLTLLNNK